VMQKRAMARSRTVSLAVAGLLALAARAEAAPSGGRYSARPLTLEARTLRLDFAPPDFALLDSGEVNEGRGVRLSRGADHQIYFGIGAGLGYGITDNVEVGALVLPLLLHPTVRYGDAEVYGRFRLLHGGRFALGLQAGLQLPTDTRTAAAFGVPMLAHVGDSVRLDFGPELEIPFYRDRGSMRPHANLDFPFAVAWDLGAGGFVGLRTGVFVPGAWPRDTSVKFGVQGGPILADGNVDLVLWVLWPTLLVPGAAPRDQVQPDHFEVGVGATIRLGT